MQWQVIYFIHKDAGMIYSLVRLPALSVFIIKKLCSVNHHFVCSNEIVYHTLLWMVHLCLFCL